MRHAFTIVELLLVSVDFSVCLEHFGNNQVLKCSKCQQMFSNLHILLKDNNITLHMSIYTYFCLYDMKIVMCVSKLWRIVLPVIIWFLFGEVSSSSGCLGWATLFYCGTL